MKLRFLGFLAVLMAALAAPKRAAADPITAVIAAINTFAASSAIAGFVVKIGFSLAFSALSTVLQKRKGAPAPERGGIKTETTTNGGTNPQTFVLGRFATAGNMVAPPYSFPNNGDPANHTLVYVVDIADMPGVTFERLMLAGKYVDLDQTGANSWRGFSRDGRWRFHMHLQDGYQQAADSWMMANFADHPTRPWQDDMVGTGVTYAVLRFYYTPELWNQLPGVRFEVMGIPLYDPRQDDTVGGSGSHRWDDPTTWAQTENPMVMVYNILRGITLPDGRVWGGKASAEDLPLASWFAAMNECDVQVPLADGGTEPQYRAGLEVAVDEEPADVIDELLAACSAEIAEFGGIYKPRVGPPALPVYFFTDDDIIADRPEKLTPFPGLDEVHNAIHATYPEPAALWERSDAPPRYNAGWEAEDNGRQLVAEVELSAVPYGTQVQRLMQAWIEDERRFRRHSLTLPPDAAILEPLDTCAWTSAEHGYSGKVFEVAELTDDFDTCLQTVAIRERDAGDFTWVPGTDEIPVVHPNPDYLEPAPRILPGFAAARYDLVDTSSTARRPGLRLSWVADELLATDRIEYQLQLADGTAVSSGTVMDALSGEVILSAGLIPDTDYRARARIVTLEGVEWSAWEYASTGDVLFSGPDIAPASVDWAKLGSDVLGNIESLTAVVAGRGVSFNPLFSDWPGAMPTGYEHLDAIAGTATKDTAGAKYTNAVILETLAVPSGDGPTLQLQPSNWPGHLQLPAHLVNQIVVEADLELMAGDWSSSRVKVTWAGAPDGGASGSVFIYLSDHLKNVPGLVQRLSVVAEVPPEYVQGGQADDLRLELQAASTDRGGPFYAQIRVHSLDFRLIDGTAEASMFSKVAALDDIQAAAIGLRVVSGTENQEIAELELVSLSDPTGESQSSARISADNILLDGSVRATYMQVDEFLDIDAQNAGFRMDKASPVDYANDGVYMGRHVDQSGQASFGFFIGGKKDGKDQYLRLTKEDGLIIKNAIYTIGGGAYTDEFYTESQAVSLTGMQEFSATLVGGGGGGRGGTAFNGSGGTGGQPGGDTVVELYDGATLVTTWTASGGAGGGSVHSSSQAGKNSSQSPYGNSGGGGTRGRKRTDTEDRTGPVTTWQYGKYGGAGSTGQVLQINSYDISGLTDPNLVITIGDGGNGGSGGGVNATGSNWQSWAGGNGKKGQAGAVAVQGSGETAVPAGPVAFEPTAEGSFVASTGGGSFPVINPGRGMWLVWWEGAFLWRNIEIAPGSFIDFSSSKTDGLLTFVANQTPTWTSSNSNKTIVYKFWAM